MSKHAKMAISAPGIWQEASGNESLGVDKKEPWDSAVSMQLARKVKALNDTFCKPRKSYLTKSGLFKSSCFVRRRLNLPSDEQVA